MNINKQVIQIMMGKMDLDTPLKDELLHIGFQGFIKNRKERN
jgi:hypothetical protein